jgi:A/G-specific adenine glycosylase
MSTLLEWFRTNGRHDLPWRQTRDPYKIYISEVMLQQTQVERVKEYYARFLERFPTLRALSKASQEEVLALWSGLGYYSRATNLLKTARICGDRLPNSYEELLKLPGIGDYTASAICSFAYNQPVAVIDTNIKRLICRHFATTTNLKSLAHRWLDRSRPKEHNLALMDLGALVCTPKNPACSSCPLHATCQGKHDPLAFTKPKKRRYENLELFLGICVQKNRIALIPSKEKLYKGLLVLPHVEPVEENYLATLSHTYTKYRIKAYLYRMEPPHEARWIELDRIDEAPVSSLVKKVCKIIISLDSSAPELFL